MSSRFLREMMSLLSILEDGEDKNVTKCTSDIDHYTFYQFCLVPAVVLTLLMAWTKRRKELFLDFLYGRPALIYPMDTLTSSSRISYCCAFGATGTLIYQILIEQQFAINYNGPIALKVLIAILSVFVYGIVFFPVFACLALRSAFSYALGSLYIWMFFVIEIYQLTECQADSSQTAVLVVRALPSLGCLGYLSISLPVRFIIACYKKRLLSSPCVEDPYNETEEMVKDSFQGRHVRKLLQKPETSKELEGKLNKLRSALAGVVKNLAYQRHRGFRYPSRFVSVMFIGAFVVYLITVEFLTMFVSSTNIFIRICTTSLDGIGWSQGSNDTLDVIDARNGLLFVYNVFYVIKVSIIVSITCSCAISGASILHMITSFRLNLFAMYRGDYSKIPPPSSASSASLCVGSIKFAGFQVAYIVWGYVVQFIVLFLICIILAIFIFLLKAGLTDWLVNKFLQLWPSVAVALVLMVAQLLLARYIFLQKPGIHLRLGNRRFFFIFNFFMFFYNIFLGIFSCLQRIIKAIAIGVLTLGRLDNSTLPRQFEFLDPGFSAYKGYIHLEAAHTHPVVNVFIRLLTALSKARKENSGVTSACYVQTGPRLVSFRSESLQILQSQESNPRPINLAARFNWYLVYTLLQNPSVRIHRRGYVEALKQARKRGLKIPISDKPITDFDLAKAQQESEKNNLSDAIVVEIDQENTLITKHDKIVDENRAVVFEMI